MPLRPDRLTEKSQEAIAQAQAFASEAQQQEVSPEHLLRALLEQNEGAVPAILSKLGANPQQLGGSVQAYLDRQPKVYGASSRRPGTRWSGSRTNTSPPNTCCWPSWTRATPKALDCSSRPA